MESSSRKGKRRNYDVRLGSAARKLAVESVRNVANWGVRDSDVEAAADTDAELAAIVSVLRNAGTPLAIAEAAEQLPQALRTQPNTVAFHGMLATIRYVPTGTRAR